jgi:hypothetical protein
MKKKLNWWYSIISTKSDATWDLETAAGMLPI